MEVSMRAIVLDRPGSFRVAEVPDPTPGPGQVVVKVDCCGICGTDIHIMDGEFPPTPYPITPGHEFAGTVAAVGPDVTMDLPVGARVAVDPGIYCGYCRRCRAGRGNLCENWAAIGDTIDGAFAEYVAVPAANVYRLPDGFDGQAAAMIEPLACAVHGLRRLGPVFGDSILLTGAGTMGLLLLQLLTHAGAGAVTVVDRVSDRLQVAGKLGAARVVTDIGELAGEKFEIVVDATGVPVVLQAAPVEQVRGGLQRLRRVAGRGHAQPLAVPRLQRRDHRHRLDGDPGQLRPGRRADNQRRGRPAPAAQHAATARGVRRGPAPGTIRPGD
jgi:2-desacetyl-2-hydroxyethyl bacteriochlorophyllide A dehydrogenase